MAKSTRSKPTSKTQKPAPLEGNKVWRERGRVRKSSPTLRDKTAWEKLPEWWQHVICVGFLLVVALGFFAPTTFGGRTLVGGDTVQWLGTAQAMLDYEASSNGKMGRKTAGTLMPVAVVPVPSPPTSGFRPLHSPFPFTSRALSRGSTRIMGTTLVVATAWCPVLVSQAALRLASSK